MTKFDEVVLPQLDAARRLARWLIANEHDAEDAVQEACLRAFRYFRTFAGGDGRAWFLRIVRNTCYGWYNNSRQLTSDVFDEELHSGETLTMDPEALMLHAADAALIEQAMKELPDRFRDLLVLRELEGFSYQELAQVLGIPIGSVMSGLSRARQAFRRVLETRLEKEAVESRMRIGNIPTGTKVLRSEQGSRRDAHTRTVWKSTPALVQSTPARRGRESAA